MNLILLGPPGAGKGTQAAKIIEKYDIPHISTGDIFRANIKEGTELGKKAQEYMNKGELVPDELVVEIATDRLKADDCRNGFLAAQGKKVDHVLDIDVDKDELMVRLTGRRVCKTCGASFHIVNIPPKVEGICDECGAALIQRADDNAETAANRIEVYNKETKPLIDYYEKAGNIAHLDGTIGLENVFNAIVEVLGE